MFLYLHYRLSVVVTRNKSLQATRKSIEREEHVSVYAFTNVYLSASDAGHKVSSQFPVIGSLNSLAGATSPTSSPSL